MQRFDAQMPQMSRSGGFTLIELLVALMILALSMGVVATTLMRGSTSFEVRAASADIADFLRAARLDAMSNGQRTVVDFDSEQRGFARTGDIQLALPHGVEAAVGSASAAGKGRIVFFQNGTSTGGRIELYNSARRACVNVDWLTGSVTREEACS